MAIHELAGNAAKYGGLSTDEGNLSVRWSVAAPNVDVGPAGDRWTADTDVLIVEDEMLIALLIEDALVDLGCEVVGPAGKVETDLQLVRDVLIDIAILDVTIRDEKVYPVAEQLIARAIPFVLASGYGDWALPEYLRDRPRLPKPFTVADKTASHFSGSCI